VTQEANAHGQHYCQLWTAWSSDWRKSFNRVVADSGYTTRENIEKMAGRGIDFLGAHATTEDVPRGANLPNGFHLSAFLYQPEEEPLCLSGGQSPASTGTTQGRRGMTYHIYEARLEDCRSCPRKPECCPTIRSTAVRLAQLEESPVVMAFRKKWLARKVQQTISVGVDESWSFVTHGSRQAGTAAVPCAGPGKKSADGKCCGLA